LDSGDCPGLDPGFTGMTVKKSLLRVVTLAKAKRRQQMERNAVPKKWILGVDNGLNLLRELEKEITKTSLLRDLPVAIHSNSPTSLEISNGFKRSQNGKKTQVYFFEGGFGEPSFPLEYLLTKPLSPWWSRLSENIRFSFPKVGRPPEWRSPLTS